MNVTVYLSNITIVHRFFVLPNNKLNICMLTNLSVIITDNTLEGKNVQLPAVILFTRYNKQH